METPRLQVPAFNAGRRSLNMHRASTAGCRPHRYLSGIGGAAITNISTMFRSEPGRRRLLVAHHRIRQMTLAGEPRLQCYVRDRQS